MILRGIELLYFKLSYKFKAIKDNLRACAPRRVACGEKHLNYLLIKPSQNNIEKEKRSYTHEPQNRGTSKANTSGAGNCTIEAPVRARQIPS